MECPRWAGRVCLGDQDPSVPSPAGRLICPLCDAVTSRSAAGRRTCLVFGQPPPPGEDRSGRLLGGLAWDTALPGEARLPNEQVKGQRTTGDFQFLLHAFLLSFQVFYRDILY